MHIRELAEIQTGLVLSRKQAEIKWSSSPFIYRVFTLSSFTQSGLVHEQLGTFEAKEDVGDKYLSEVGDVVVRLSAPNYAVLIDNETAGVLIPSQFLKVRITYDGLTPEYLTIYLNSDDARRQIEKSSVGTVIKVLTVAEFAEIRVPIPPLIEQERIARLYDLIRRQAYIKDKLKSLEEIKNKYYIDKLLKGVSQ